MLNFRAQAVYESVAQNKLNNQWNIPEPEEKE